MIQSTPREFILKSIETIHRERGRAEYWAQMGKVGRYGGRSIWKSSLVIDEVISKIEIGERSGEGLGMEEV